MQRHELLLDYPSVRLLDGQRRGEKLSILLPKFYGMDVEH